MPDELRSVAVRSLMRNVLIGDGCWEWKGQKFGDYGIVWNGRSLGAHRAMYLFLRGSIPKGLELDHLCRNPGCVNPDHLEPVTHRENLRRGMSPVGFKARQTHCIRGHALAGLNLYTYKGRRQCRACRSVSDARSNARKKERKQFA